MTLSEKNPADRNKVPAVLMVAGSDNSGGAGIQADLKTFGALGTYGLSAITAVTAQNTRIPGTFQEVAADLVFEQIRMSIGQIFPAAMKTGMLVSAEIVRETARAIRELGLPFPVVDPVLKSSAGGNLGKTGLASSLITDLLPVTAVLTPNIPEAEALSGIRIRNREDIREACRVLAGKGARAIIVKGGHAGFEDSQSTDILFTNEVYYEFSGPRLKLGEFHGTGCTYSAALCAYLAKGLELVRAAELAKEFVVQAMLSATPENPGILNHFWTIK